MLEARLGKEIVLDVRNDIGILHDVSRVLSEKGVEIFAVNETALGNTCTVRLITDDGLRIKDALRARAYNPREESVVMVDLPHKPGMLKRLTETLGEAQVRVDRLYTTASAKEKTSTIVFHCDNDEKALVKLSEANWH